MKPIATTQEIILATGTRFLDREACLIRRDKNREANPPINELERACWAGLIFELLPELSSSSRGTKAFTWNVYSADHFVLVNLGTAPSGVEAAFSVDPYHFVDETRLN
jgi:hypothetical protein